MLTIVPGSVDARRSPLSFLVRRLSPSRLALGLLTETGYIKFDNNVGNGATKFNKWNGLGYLRCMEYMGVISNHCGGQGGTYETGFGQVSCLDCSLKAMTN
jgi:hypothetical protein